MTSSPGPMSSASSAITSASVPLATPTQGRAAEALRDGRLQRAALGAEDEAPAVEHSRDGGVDLRAKRPVLGLDVHERHGHAAARDAITGCACGRVTVTSVPKPSREIAVAEPPNRSAMCLTIDRPEAGAAEALRPRGVGAVEALEDVLQVALRDARPVVGDAQHDRVRRGLPETTAVAPGPAYLIAFSIRLRTTVRAMVSVRGAQAGPAHLEPHGDAVLARPARPARGPRSRRPRPGRCAPTTALRWWPRAPTGRGCR